MEELIDRDSDPDEKGSSLENPAAESEKIAAPKKKRSPLREKIEELEKELKESEDQVKDLRDKYLRALADMDNYRKRIRKELQAACKASTERLVCDVLPVLDNLERALEPGSSPSEESFRDGVRMIYNMFKAVLEREGLRDFCSVGERFDPAKHEAVYSIESEEHPAETVVHEIEKGYTMNDRLLRPARVTVSKGPGASRREEPEESRDQS